MPGYRKPKWLRRQQQEFAQQQALAGAAKPPSSMGSLDGSRGAGAPAAPPPLFAAAPPPSGSARLEFPQQQVLLAGAVIAPASMGSMGTPAPLLPSDGIGNRGAGAPAAPPLDRRAPCWSRLEDTPDALPQELASHLETFRRAAEETVTRCLGELAQLTAHFACGPSTTFQERGSSHDHRSLTALRSYLRAGGDLLYSSPARRCPHDGSEQEVRGPPAGVLLDANTLSLLADLGWALSKKAEESLLHASGRPLFPEEGPAPRSLLADRSLFQQCIPRPKIDAFHDALLRCVAAGGRSLLLSLSSTELAQIMDLTLRAPGNGVRRPGSVWAEGTKNGSGQGAPVPSESGRSAFSDAVSQELFCPEVGDEPGKKLVWRRVSIKFLWSPPRPRSSRQARSSSSFAPQHTIYIVVVYIYIPFLLHFYHVLDIRIVTFSSPCRPATAFFLRRQRKSREEGQLLLWKGGSAYGPVQRRPLVLGSPAQ